MRVIRFDYDQAAWGSRRVYRDGVLKPFTPDKVIVHWGGNGREARGVAEEMRFLRSWQSWHIYGRGWVDIAYAFAVGNTGSSYRLRGYNRSGAQTGDYEGDGIKENHEALAIIWIGGKAGVISPAAFATMNRLVAEAGFDTLIGHREVTPSKWRDCPGDTWLAWIHNPPPPPPTTEDTMWPFYETDGYNEPTPPGRTHKREDVRWLQSKMNDLGARITVDGKLGPGTLAAFWTILNHPGDSVIDGGDGYAFDVIWAKQFGGGTVDETARNAALAADAAAEDAAAQALAAQGTANQATGEATRANTRLDNV